MNSELNKSLMHTLFILLNHTSSSVAVITRVVTRGEGAQAQKYKTRASRLRLENGKQLTSLCLVVKYKKIKNPPLNIKVLN